METIDACSTLPGEVEALLINNGIVNWIGGRDGFDFNIFFAQNIKTIDGFNPGKGEKLIADIRRLSVPHDLAYLMGGTYTQFIFANWVFSRDLFKLLNWVKLGKRFVIFVIIIILLNRHGKEYFIFR